MILREDERTGGIVRNEKENKESVWKYWGKNVWMEFVIEKHDNFFFFFIWRMILSFGRIWIYEQREKKSKIRWILKKIEREWLDVGKQCIKKKIIIFEYYVSLVCTILVIHSHFFCSDFIFYQYFSFKKIFFLHHDHCSQQFS